MKSMTMITAHSQTEMASQPDNPRNCVMTSNSIDNPAEPPPKVITTARGYTRTLHARLVLFRCEWCSQEQQVWQYPGATPRYCEGCRAQAQQSMNTARQREKRQREREQERQANPYAWRRSAGRSRKIR
jgi:hypothetical protein